MFYKMYTFSPLATLCSVLINLFSAIIVVIGIGLLSGSSMVVGIILIAVGAGFWLLLGRKIPDKVAEKNGKKNIETKASYALTYCIQHPEAIGDIMAVNQKFNEKVRNDVSYAHRIATPNPQYFDALCELNSELREKYELNENGKVKKIK